MSRTHLHGDSYGCGIVPSGENFHTLPGVSKEQWGKPERLGGSPGDQPRTSWAGMGTACPWREYKARDTVQVMLIEIQTLGDAILPWNMRGPSRRLVDSFEARSASGICIRRFRNRLIRRHYLRMNARVIDVGKVGDSLHCSNQWLK